MIVLVSQTKLPDSSNPLSDIVGAVQYMILTNKYLSILDQDINKNNNNVRVFGIPKKFLSVG